MSFSKRSNFSKTTSKGVLCNSTTNLSKIRNSIGVHSLSGSLHKGSDADLTISSFVQIPLKNVKLTTLYVYPDYEEELATKRNIIERDKLKSLILFPSDDIELKKIKKDEVFEWYSIYGAKDLKYINVLGRKVVSIEILSAKRQNFVITNNYENYNGPFFTLPKFSPTTETLLRHEYSRINISGPDKNRPVTTHQAAESDEVLYRGYLEIYSPYIEANVPIDKWIASTSPKKRFFSLNRPVSQTYYRLQYKKEDDEKLKYKGVYFLEYCLCFRQSNIKPFSFEMHINQKIIILVASSSKEFNNWIKSLSDATGLALERERDSKSSSLQKRTTSVQETWTSSGIPILCEYSKESDAMNQKLRNEKRYKLYDLHTNIIWYSDKTNVETDSVYVIGEKQGRRLFFEFSNIDMRVSYVEPFVLTFAIYDLKDKCKISEDFVCDPADPALLQYLKFNQEFTNYHNIVNGSGKYLEDKRINKFFYDFLFTHDDIYLVLHVSKIYTCKLNTLWEYYQKSGAKTEAKLGKVFLETAADVKKYTMPVGFSFKRLFYRGELDDETNFHTLMKHVGLKLINLQDYKLSSTDLIKYIEEYKKLY
ncbi:hypothetical protein MXB_4773 [Myxobolus squamalis]|nr:hypothetical protein MXB_4773 [Myxobolus squamalis]